MEVEVEVEVEVVMEVEVEVEVEAKVEVEVEVVMEEEAARALTASPHSSNSSAISSSCCCVSSCTHFAIRPPLVTSPAYVDRCAAPPRVRRSRRIGPLSPMPLLIFHSGSTFSRHDSAGPSVFAWRASTASSKLPWCCAVYESTSERRCSAWLAALSGCSVRESGVRSGSYV